MKKIYTIILLAILPFGTSFSQTVPLSLKDCRLQALGHNEDLQKADIAVSQAGLDKQVAFAAYLPKLDASGTAIFHEDVDLLSDVELQMRGTYLAGLNLTQPIFAGGKIVTSNKLAKVGEEVAKLQRAKTEQQVIADADRAYFTLVAVSQKVKMLEALRLQMEGLYNQVNTGVEAGVATQNDLLRISAKQSEVEYQLQKARNGEALCRLSLCNVMGADLDSVFEPTDTTFSSSSVIYDVLGTPDISQRPELGLLEQGVLASELQVKMQRANMLPTIGVSLGYTHFDNLKLKGSITALNERIDLPIDHTISSTNPMALLSVSIPIWHWGSENRKVRRAKMDVESARLDQQKNTRLLTIEAQNAAINLSDSQRMLRTAVQGQDQADENLRVTRLNYDNGMVTLTDLLDAQSQWQQAHSNLIEAQTQLRINETEYLRTTGALTM